MHQFLQMTVEERQRCKFIPLGDSIYNGLGYMLGSDAGWTDDSMMEFIVWRNRNDVKFDLWVYEFPDEETFIMARLIFE